ncbi:hypothetical protein [Neptunicella sp. SCSIO 80796]|uniref:hypothetical protein n=1 Tax=Neptunicella plasticusilytica TaxID=3117012 RepID=UPI003A4E1638
MNTQLFIPVFSTLLLTISSGTLAASHNKLVYLNQYDLDNNGELALTEFDQARKQRFDLTDEDHNGLVDENEYVFEYQNRMDKQLAEDRLNQVKQTVVRFKSLDKNDNGRVEWSEYQASGERSFTHYDGNQDNVINKDEPPKSRPNAQKPNEELQTAQQIEDEKQLALQRAKRLLRMPSTHSSNGFFSKYDSDQDGIISRAEFDQRRRNDFDLTDEDKNGWLSQQEYLFEYENRLDQQIARTRKGAIKQTYVRFNILDKDKNGGMTFAEYQLSGHRSFNRWDTNQDGVVSMLDPEPEQRRYAKDDKANNTGK